MAIYSNVLNDQKQNLALNKQTCSFVDIIVGVCDDTAATPCLFPVYIRCYILKC